MINEQLRLSLKNPIFRDHKAYGQELLPGLAYIDLIFQIFQKHGYLYRELELRNLAIYNPLTVGQDYDVILFQFILPNEVKLYYCTKEAALENIMVDGHGQHGGGDATETYWITFDLETVPNYIIPIEHLLPNE